jgi:H/ACA ribonucleoprotein complex non-core subunit NAF1
MEAGKDHEGFKIPSAIPQDLLLIQDLIGPLIPPLKLPAVDPDDSVDSSGESTDSAEEVEANLLFVGGKSTRSVSFHVSDPITKRYASEDISDSTSESSSSSSSDSESERGGEVSKKFLKSKVVDDEDEEEEEGGAVAATVRTKNEFSEPDIMIPPVLQVGPDEQLERVGEIMNIVNNVVIVKGGESGTHRASENALDAETLLVYDDRKVLGYVSTI